MKGFRIKELASVIGVGEVKKPQINADERRYASVAEFVDNLHANCIQIARNTVQESLCPQRSLWLNIYFAPAHEHTPMQPAHAVHLRTSRAGNILFWREKI